MISLLLASPPDFSKPAVLVAVDGNNLRLEFASPLWKGWCESLYMLCPGNGTIRRCVPVEVGVALLE